MMMMMMMKKMMTMKKKRSGEGIVERGPRSSYCARAFFVLASLNSAGWEFFMSVLVVGEVFSVFFLMCGSFQGVRSRSPKILRRTKTCARVDSVSVYLMK